MKFSSIEQHPIRVARIGPKQKACAEAALAYSLDGSSIMKVQVRVKKDAALEVGNDQFGNVTVNIPAEELREVSAVLTAPNVGKDGCEGEGYEVARHPSYLSHKLPRFEVGVATPGTVMQHLRRLRVRMAEIADEVRSEVHESPRSFISKGGMGGDGYQYLRPYGLDGAPDDIIGIVKAEIEEIRSEVLRKAEQRVRILYKAMELGDELVSYRQTFDDYLFVDIDEPIRYGCSSIRIRLKHLSKRAMEMVQEAKNRKKGEWEVTDRRNEKRKREKEEQNRRKQEHYEAERADWIREHGSRRLRRMLEEGIECDAVYRDERLGHELGEGWGWIKHVRGEGDEPRNVLEDAFTTLDEARSSRPDARLNYWTVEPETESEQEEAYYEDSKYVWTGCVAVARFLGSSVIYGYEGPEKASDC